MQLISAEGAKAEFRKVSVSLVADSDWMKGYKTGLIAAAEAIDEMPTIEAEPVKHGRWIKPTKINGRNFSIPHCSVCEDVPCGVNENTHYCPNCGAKMDEEC